MRGGKDLNVQPFRHLDEEAPDVFHDGPVQPGIDFIDQQEPVFRPGQSKSEGEQPAYAIAVITDLDSAGYAAASHQYTAASQPFSGQEVD